MRLRKFLKQNPGDILVRKIAAIVVSFNRLQHFSTQSSKCSRCLENLGQLVIASIITGVSELEALWVSTRTTASG